MRAILLLSVISLLLLGGNAIENSISIRDSNLAFAWTWGDYVIKNPGNVVFSPLSAHAILTGVYQGAEGSTKEIMAEKLLLPEREEAVKGYSKLFEIEDDNEDIVKVANKLYVQSGHELKTDIEEKLGESFYTKMESIDFAENKEAAADINSWVEDYTNNKFKNIISSSDLNADTRLALLNAVYSRGKWKKEFSENATENRPFHLDGNNSIIVPTMYQEGVFKYKIDRDRGFKVIELPFINEEYILSIVLPIDQSGLSELIDNLLSTKDETILYDGLDDKYVKVSLPKFKLEKDANLQEVLQEKFGLGELFDASSCNLSGLLKDGEEPLHVGKIIQIVLLDINESGCEASIETESKEVIILDVPNLLLEEFEEFKADHPFLFEIRYKNHVNLPVLLGKISNPEEN